MRLATYKLAACIGVALTVAAAGLPAAKAERWNDIGRCYGTLEGIGTGRGVFGRGSARARVAARANWEATAARTYGPAFSRLSRAEDVRWDCKQRAILLAKCVVTAKPCGARIRG